MKAFLKWAGGKYLVLPHLKPLLPKGKRLIEPFVGSGTVFLYTDYNSYLLADNNDDLISLYKHLQSEGEDFIHYCETFFTPENNCKEKYYEFRSLFNEAKDTRLRSALFIYLNRHGYNGLCRYNSKGGFNVPFGSYSNPSILSERMLAFHHKAKNAEFISADFVDTMQMARKGDIIYCDPPYAPLSENSRLINYSKLLFDEEQQCRLAHKAEKLANKNIPVIISNHNTEFTRSIYANAKIISFDIKRRISCDVNSRNKAKELLALFA